MKIAISLLVHNDLSYLKPCIESLIESDLSRFDFKFFVADNASSQEMQDYFTSLQHPCLYRRNETNCGITIPRIQIMQQILKEGFDYTLEIHADMLFPDVWFEPLISIMDDQTGVAMPFILNNPNVILTRDQLQFLVDRYKKNLVFNNVRQVHPWLLNNKVVKRIGYYHPAFSPQICEDDDFVLNVIRNGYALKATKNSIVCHYGGKTRSVSGLPAKVLRNFRIFQIKNGITVEEMIERFSLHPVITEYTQGAI